MLSTEKKIPVPEEQAATCFTDLRWKYSDTFIKVKAIVRERVTLEKLKEQVETQFPDLEDVVENAHTSDEVMKLFWKNSCSFPYLNELHALVRILSLSEAEEEIKQYEEMRMKVYQEVLEKDFAKSALKEYENDNNVKVRYAQFSDVFSKYLHAPIN